MRVNSIGARHYSARRRPAYIAFLVHRLSGLALALFLPVIFGRSARHYLPTLHSKGSLDDRSPMVKEADGRWVLLATPGGALRLLRWIPSLSGLQQS